MSNTFEEQMAQALAISAAEASSSTTTTTTTSTPHRIVSPAISAALKVGDRVCVKSSRPMNGWGPVTPNDVGIITLVLPPVVAVSFGQKTNHLGEHGWTCSISDLVKLTGSNHHHQHSSPQHDTQSDLEMAFRLQRNEEETRRVRAEASQKYHESKTSSSSSSSSFATLRQDSSNSVALHDRRILNEAEASNVLSGKKKKFGFL
jgi:hypothetical protein